MTTASIAPITNVVLEPGLKYGKSGIRNYGVNLQAANDTSSDTEFMALMQDDDIVNNIKENIDAAIANNKGKTPKDPDFDRFSIIVSPSSMADFMNTESTLMTRLIKDPVYKPYVKTWTVMTVGY